MQGTRLKEEDLIDQVVHTTAHSHLLLVLEPRQGLPAAGTRDSREGAQRPRHADRQPPSARADESIQAIVETRTFDPDQYLLFATKSGQVKKTPFTEYDKSRREGFIAINLNDGDELVRVVRTGGDDDLLMVSRNGMTIRFCGIGGPPDGPERRRRSGHAAASG